MCKGMAPWPLTALLMVLSEQNCHYFGHGAGLSIFPRDAGEGGKGSTNALALQRRRIC